MTKEEFLATYLDHIEGRVDTEEKGARPDTAGEDSKEALMSPKGDDDLKDGEGDGEGVEGEEGEKPEGT